MNLRLQLSPLSVKALEVHRNKAVGAGDIRVVRRCGGLLEVLSGRQPVASLAAQWQISAATIYEWTLSMSGPCL